MIEQESPARPPDPRGVHAALSLHLVRRYSNLAPRPERRHPPLNGAGPGRVVDHIHENLSGDLRLSCLARITSCLRPHNPDHMTENIGVMHGGLPDERMRERMVRHMETLPGFADLLTMPQYLGKKFDGVVKPG